MRLIDADELLKKLNEERIQYNADINYFITNAPTVEAEPVRRGKWVVAGDTTHYYICSVCGAPGDCFDNYCRSCGARMGEEEKDEYNRGTINILLQKTRNLLYRSK